MRCGLSGGIGSFQRPDADLQYLSLVAAAALERHPQSLLLLVAPTDTDPNRKDQTGVFLLAGAAGEAHVCGGVLSIWRDIVLVFALIFCCLKHAVFMLL